MKTLRPDILPSNAVIQQVKKWKEENRVQLKTDLYISVTFLKKKGGGAVNSHFYYKMQLTVSMLPVKKI